MKISKKVVLSLLIIALPILTFAGQSNNFNLDILNNQQTAIANIQYDLSVSTDDKNDGSITQRGDLQGSINSLKNALKESKPNSYINTELTLALASLEISNNSVNDARKTLNSLGTIESYNNPILQIFLAAYSLIWDPNNFDQNIEILKESKWSKMPHFIQAIQTAKTNFDLGVNSKLDQLKDIDQNSLAIVTLGYSLNDDGSMSNILVDRLKITLAAHKKYPDAIIIVSGGVAHEGVTESYQMKQWLIKHGVSAQSIIQEDQSTSTVTNAINTINIIKKINRPVKNILLISSDSHIRRANSIFEQEIYNAKLPIKMSNITARTNYDIDKPAQQQEKILIIKDTLRTAGIWQMPGMVF
ncbi:YdcF family protein [Francisella philomiragia]